MASVHVKFETPADVQKKALEAIEAARAANGVRKGTNECTKAVERGEATLVVIAEDVDPPEIVMHLPQLCSEKKVPYVYVASKVSIGKAAGLNVGSSAIAVTKPGNAANEQNIKDIASKMAAKYEFKTEDRPATVKEAKEKKKADKAAADKADKAAKPKKEKPAETKEEKAAEKPAEKAAEKPAHKAQEDKPAQAKA
jgi:large subunit ribosomal protein L7Ae